MESERTELITGALMTTGVKEKTAHKQATAAGKSETAENLFWQKQASEDPPSVRVKTFFIDPVTGQKKFSRDIALRRSSGVQTTEAWLLSPAIADAPKVQDVLIGGVRVSKANLAASLEGRAPLRASYFPNQVLLPVVAPDNQLCVVELNKVAFGILQNKLVGFWGKKVDFKDFKVQVLLAQSTPPPLPPPSPVSPPPPPRGQSPLSPYARRVPSGFQTPVVPVPSSPLPAPRPFSPPPSPPPIPPSPENGSPLVRPPLLDTPTRELKVGEGEPIPVSVVEADGSRRQGSQIVPGNVANFYRKMVSEGQSKGIVPDLILLNQSPDFNRLKNPLPDGSLVLNGFRVNPARLAESLRGVVAGPGQTEGLNRYKYTHEDSRTGIEYSRYYLPIVSLDGNLVLIGLSLEDYSRMRDLVLGPGSVVRRDRLWTPSGFHHRREEFMVSGQDSPVETANGGIRLGPAVFKVEMASTKGGVRGQDEDGIAVYQGLFPGDLPFANFELEDGMGGHDAGDIASEDGVESGQRYLSSLKEEFENAPQKENTEWASITKEAKSVLTRLQAFEGAVGQMQARGEPVGEAIRWLPRGRKFDQMDAIGLVIADRMMQAQNRFVRQKNIQLGKDAGATKIGAIALSVNGGVRLFVAQAGDSRLAAFDRAHQLFVATRDHSLIERLVSLGQVTRAEAATHPQRSAIYRVLGDKASVGREMVGDPVPAGEIGKAIFSVFILDFGVGEEVALYCDGCNHGEEFEPGARVALDIANWGGRQGLAADVVKNGTVKTGDNASFMRVLRVQ